MRASPDGGGSRPLRVLHFTNSRTRGGAEEHILTLLAGLDRALFRPFLACPPEVAAKLEPDVPPDVTVIALCLREPRHLGAAVRLASLLRRHRIDILHSHLFYSSLFASPIGRLCGVPVVVETPHVRERWREGRGAVKSSFVVDRLVGRFVDHFVAVSQSNAAYLRDEKRLPARKVVAIENGCDLDRFANLPDPAPLRQSLGIGDHAPVLAVFGRLEPQKGHRVLLDALPALLRAHPRARLVCVGEGAERAGLEARVRGLGLDGAVLFTGYQADVRPWLALADVVVLPSLYEGLPLVAIEALAASRALVATAVDGTPEVVLDGETGLTVPPGDAPALAAAVSRVLAEPGLRRRLAAAGRVFVEERFGRERQVERTAELYLTAWRRAVGEPEGAAETVRERRARAVRVPEAEAGGR
jgi:glycosyltransferase involved in cell wall biosynthesis